MTIAALAVSASLACDDTTGGLAIADPVPDSGCIRPGEPATYEVFFVLDVSGSMGPFLMDLRSELVAFADGLPETDADGRRIRVDYYVIAFVNDVKMFGNGRMTSIIALQSAFDDAITAGQTNYNLNVRTFNSEPEENLLDAIGLAIEQRPSAEARMLFVATDAPFKEAPDTLHEMIQVQRTYESVYADLEMLEMRVHAFTASAVDGITRGFGNHKALTELPGSSVHRLQELTGARQKIQDTLRNIAADSVCN